MRAMLRKPDEARSGATTSELAPEGADHSIASSHAFVRCRLPAVLRVGIRRRCAMHPFVDGVGVWDDVAEGRVLRWEGTPGS